MANQTLQGSASFGGLASDAAFVSAPPVEQIQYLKEDYLPKRDPAFAKASDQEKNQYIQEVVLPQIQSIKPPQAPVAPSPSQQAQIDPRFTKNSPPISGPIPQFQATPGGFAPTTTEAMEPFQAGQALGVGQVLKGATLGYADPAQAIQAAYPNQNIKQLQQNPVAQIPQEVGTTLPYMLAGAGLEGAIKKAGASLLPYTATAAIEGGLSSPVARPLMNTLTYLQQPGWVPAMIKSGMELGGIEGLKSHPDNQFNIGARLNDAATGAAMGSLLSAGGSAVGKGLEMAGPHLEAGAKFFQEVMNPSGLWHQKFTPRMEELLQRLIALIDHPGLTKKESEVITEQASRVASDLQNGRLTQNLPKIEKKAKMYESRAKFREMRGQTRKGNANVEEGQIQYSQGQQPTQGAQAVQQQSASASQPQQEQKTLNASARKSQNNPNAPINDKEAAQQTAHQQAASNGTLQQSTQQASSNTQATSESAPIQKTKTVTKVVKTTVKEHTPEVQKKLDTAKSIYENKMKTLNQGKSLSGSVNIEGQKRGVGLEYAAAKRKIIQGDSLEKVEGGLTDYELGVLQQREATNYSGKAVTVGGIQGRVENVAFGKVKVKLENGNTVSVTPAEVKPLPKPKPKPTYIEREVEHTVTEEVPVEETPEKQPETSTEQPKQNAPTKLTGSVQEMVDQGLKEFGGTFDEAKTLVAEVKALGKAEDDPIIKDLTEKKKALGNKRDDATKQAKADLDEKIKARKQERKEKRDKAGAIHGNLREVLNAGWDGSSPIADQLPVDPATQLKPEQVENLITDPAEKGIFDKTKQALQGGVSMRLEHQAEITGSTDAAAKITGKGNVKVPVSTFTPTHYSVTEKELNGVKRQYVAVHGYNEAGHMSKYYINETPEGSKILKVNKMLDHEAFVGVTPNVELGKRKFKIADVLGREEREEGVLTSEALKAAQAFKAVFKTENINKFSKQTQAELKQFAKRGKFDERSFERLHEQMKKNPEDMKNFCSLFGLA